MADIGGVPAPGASAPGALVIVSNRLPFEVRWVGWEAQFRRSPGGLVTALEAALSERGGVWVGWPGVGCASTVLTQPSTLRLAPSFQPGNGSRLTVY